MKWQSIITLCIILITYFTMTGLASAANPDIGKFKEAACPFPLPEGTHDVSFWSVDCANNVEATNTETFG